MRDGGTSYFIPSKARDLVGKPQCSLARSLASLGMRWPHARWSPTQILSTALNALPSQSHPTPTSLSTHPTRAHMPELLSRLQGALSDRYRIEREIGAGGMATVYLAQDLRHDRKVALKVLRPELVRRDRRRAVPRRDQAHRQPPAPAHPPAVRLGRGRRLPLLRHAVRRGRVAARPAQPGEAAPGRRRGADRAARWPPRSTTPTGTASSTATSSPRTSCCTTGARWWPTSASRSPPARRGGSRMTETGMSLGTPHYMSPEQAMGEREITARSDVYALGAVLYEMLTGEPPFTGSTAQAIVARVLTEAPRPMLPQRHTIPPHVEAAVLTALEKLPADRFAHGGGVRGGAERDGTTCPPCPPPVRRTGGRGGRAVGRHRDRVTLGARRRRGGRRPRPRSGAGSARRPSRRSTGSASSCRRSRRSSRRPRSGNRVAISPDGQRLVYVGPARAWRAALAPRARPAHVHADRGHRGRGDAVLLAGRAARRASWSTGSGCAPSRSTAGPCSR